MENRARLCLTARLSEAVRPVLDLDVSSGFEDVDRCQLGNLWRRRADRQLDLAFT
jgi:hypothetical protein